MTEQDEPKPAQPIKPEGELPHPPNPANEVFPDSPEAAPLGPEEGLPRFPAMQPPDPDSESDPEGEPLTILPADLDKLKDRELVYLGLRLLQDCMHVLVEIREALPEPPEEDDEEEGEGA